ncbi:unnamed protein product [Pleuronectes platessa]|uniref:Uncharacterized protein n=1 Tax=Pleuronectes platessa TaxID=8262 RepID=A0A9N7Y5G1_PLEPL|nr:unnamed protein product [Pleuronectes platessa]
MFVPGQEAVKEISKIPQGMMVIHATEGKVHGQQPSRPRSTIQTRRHSSPQSPSTAAHQDPSRAAAAVLVQCPYPMANATQGPQHWVQHHDPRCAINKPQSMDTCCGILDKL